MLLPYYIASARYKSLIKPDIIVRCGVVHYSATFHREFWDIFLGHIIFTKIEADKANKNNVFLRVVLKYTQAV